MTVGPGERQKKNLKGGLGSPIAICPTVNTWGIWGRS